MKHVVEFEGRIVAVCTTSEAAEAALRLMHVDSEKLSWFRLGVFKLRWDSNWQLRIADDPGFGE